uniref:Beta-microseminoprotein n=1 Tax=Dicentrarchus labrax TaxID=13489 RepID=A0A8C4HUW0_DICLA
MKKYLSLALLLCALPALSNAVCSNYVSGRTHCLDQVDNTWHAVGSKWRNSACMDCTCGQNSLCCVSGNPQRFPEDCVKVFDPVWCEYIVHKKDDPSVLCPVHSFAGVI